MNSQPVKPSLMKQALETSYMSSLQKMDSFTLGIDPRRSGIAGSPGVSRTHSQSESHLHNHIHALRMELHMNRKELDALQMRLSQLEKGPEADAETEATVTCKSCCFFPFAKKK